MLSDFVKNNYLTFSSIGSDHEIYFNTPAELMPEIKRTLTKQMKENTNLATITFTADESNQIESILIDYDNFDINTPSRINPNYQKRVMASALIRCKLMLAILESKKDLQETSMSSAELRQIIQGLTSCSREERIQAYINAPSHYDIEDMIKRGQKTHLAIFEDNVNCSILQGAINDYIGSRTPYSIKLFTSSNNLSNSYDSNGNLISPVHDYRAIYLDRFLDTPEHTME